MLYKQTFNILDFLVGIELLKSVLVIQIPILIVFQKMCYTDKQIHISMYWRAICVTVPHLEKTLHVSHPLL